MSAPLPRRKNPPSYRHHKPTGQGVVTLNGKDFYLGKFGTPESKQAYDRMIAEWLASGRQLVAVAAKSDGLIVREVAAAFWLHAEGYYVGPDGQHTSELDNYRQALRPLEKLYGSHPATQFGPLALKAVRQEMIHMGWARTNINKQVNRIRSVFKWAASQELVPASICESLRTLAGLRSGRCDARETEPVKPVPDGDIQAIKAFVSDQVWSLIQLQLLTGARAGELVKLRPIDLDMTKDVWTHSPTHHKTAHHGHQRTINFGPKGQEVIRPYLTNRPVSAFLFSPIEAEEKRRQDLHAKRKTPPNQGNVPGSSRKSRPERRPADHYTVASYRRAIARACDKADEWAKGGLVVGNDERLVHPWHPHQLRHNAATYIRKEFGIEFSKVILGHQSLDMTQIYAEADQEKAREVVRRIG